MRKENYAPRPVPNVNATPFESAEEAWFWFISNQTAREDGARFLAGESLLHRPCDPIDILKAVDRLYRNRILQRDHLVVLRHYGQRQMPPDPRRVKEARSAEIWKESMNHLADLLVSKGIVRALRTGGNNWLLGAMVIEGVSE